MTIKWIAAGADSSSPLRLSAAWRAWQRQCRLADFAPSERAKAAGAPVEADISKLAPGEMMTVEWRGKPVWIIRRTKEMLDGLKKLDDKLADPTSSKPMQPEYAKNEHRSIKPEYLVVGRHLHPSGLLADREVQVRRRPASNADWQGGFFCPCHGSTFDLAGRVYKSKPAPDNLEVPPHKYCPNAKIVIGEDSKGA